MPCGQSKEQEKKENKIEKRIERAEYQNLKSLDYICPGGCLPSTQVHDLMEVIMYMNGQLIREERLGLLSAYPLALAIQLSLISGAGLVMRFQDQKHV